MQDTKIPELFGMQEFGNVIGFDRRKMSVYLSRNKLPEPATKVGTRSFWTKEQVESFHEEVKEYQKTKAEKRQARLSKVKQ